MKCFPPKGNYKFFCAEHEDMGSLEDVIKGMDIIHVIQGKLDIDTQNVAFLQDVISRFPAKEFQNRVLLSISDYDEDHRELFQIPEVRAWFKKLDESIPYLMFFLLPPSMKLVAHCVLDVKNITTVEGRVFLEMNTNALQKFVRDRCAAVHLFCLRNNVHPEPAVDCILEVFNLKRGGEPQ